MSSFRAELERMDTSNGVDKRVAEIVLAEIGVGFPDDKHLCSWAAICPGTNTSAGKNKFGKMRKGNNWLKAALVQVAWASRAQTRDLSFSDVSSHCSQTRKEAGINSSCPLRYLSGAQCGKTARWDLCGGSEVIPAPTATRRQIT